MSHVGEQSALAFYTRDGIAEGEGGMLKD